MILGKVLSRVVSTAKLDSLPKRALLNIQPVEDSKPVGTPIIAIDTVSAGPGDLVLILQEGTGARQAALENPAEPLPAQMVVVGIVDLVQFG